MEVQLSLLTIKLKSDANFRNKYRIDELLNVLRTTVISIREWNSIVTHSFQGD